MFAANFLVFRIRFFIHNDAWCIVHANGRWTCTYLLLLDTCWTFFFPTITNVCLSPPLCVLLPVTRPSIIDVCTWQQQQQQQAETCTLHVCMIHSYSIYICMKQQLLFARWILAIRHVYIWVQTEHSPVSMEKNSAVCASYLAASMRCGL